MRRGYIFTLEAMGVFVAWMILLFFTWQHAGHTMNTITEQQEIHERERLALETLDTLIQHHSFNPWEGCAMFSGEKKRETPYRLEKKCLEKLKTQPLPEGIAQLTLHTPTGLQLLAGNETQGECVIIRRPFLLDGTIPSALEVSVCE